MREHKFRLWDSRRKAMFEGHCTQINCYGSLKKVEWVLASASAKQNLMQFTGIFDLRGREVYEGDIVKDMSHYVSNIESKTIILDPLEYIVYYCDDEAQFRMKNDEYEQHLSLGGKTLEIVGNIYD